MARQCIKKSSVPNSIPSVATPNHRPKRNLAAKTFWKENMARFKRSRLGLRREKVFLPPDGFKQYAQKRFRTGSDVKEYFDGISEVGEYVRLNPEMKLAKKEDIAKSVNSTALPRRSTKQPATTTGKL